MYQMRQWYKPLAELARTWPVVVLSRSATGARALLSEDAPPVAFVPTVRDVERFIADQDIRVVLYVNQNTRNFQMFRYGRRWHVFINHGESDKMYMTTNQYKAYDYAFIAGEAARERLERVLWDYDLDRRTIQIGRPQADHYSGALPYTPDERTVVLYAPTWEGDRPSAHYGSIRSHGEALVHALLATGDTGSSTGRIRVPASSIPRTATRTAGSSPPCTRRTPQIRHPLMCSTTDRNSAGSSPPRMSRSWTSRRWCTTVWQPTARSSSRVPADPEALIDTNGYLSACEWLDSADAGRIVAETDRVLGDDAAVARLEHGCGTISATRRPARRPPGSTPLSAG